ncbi:MAG: hypothetical protein M1827_000873 [Pycnora praestabilis]|nr:MAG: hypothetical protein M1827_000873 [Pycnora praestabilis]
MASTDSPALLVARFLKTNNYEDTLDAFLREAGLPPDVGSVQAGDLTIEKVLEEKKIFDLSLRFEKIGVGNGKKGWSLPAPSTAHQIDTLPTASNLLHVSVEAIRHAERSEPSQVILSATADRRLVTIDPNPPKFEFQGSHHDLHDSPILSSALIAHRYLITTSMSGQMILKDCLFTDVLDSRRDHKKYVVKVIVIEDQQGAWIATAGWDAKVFLYRIRKPLTGEEDSETRPKLGEPIASLTLPSNPEAILFIRYEDSPSPLLLVSRRDSTHLFYYSLPPTLNTSAVSPQTMTLLGKQNLAPHSNAWIAFSPSSLAVSPVDPSLLAVATSSVPHMKLIIVRLLLPPLTTSADSTTEPATQAAQTRANLAIQDKEDLAIISQSNTLATQTPYSTPQVIWRPDGSGVWVNGDDGVIRGLEAETGKVVASLKSGHEPGSKVRSIWCGIVNVKGDNEEWVISGGFDRRLIVWRPSEET